MTAKGDACESMLLDLWHACSSHLDWFVRDLPRDRWAAYAIAFIGKTIEQSKPVIIIYSKDKKLRRRILKKFQLVRWLRSNSSFSLGTYAGVHFRARVEEARRRHLLELKEGF